MAGDPFDPGATIPSKSDDFFSFFIFSYNLEIMNEVWVKYIMNKWLELPHICQRKKWKNKDWMSIKLSSTNTLTSLGIGGQTSLPFQNSS